MKNRIISFLLAGVMALTLLAPTSAQALAPEQDEIFSILEILGWMTPDSRGSFYGSTDVTRAALAKIIVTSSNTLRGTVSTTQKVSPFKDVPYTFWGAPYVSAVAQAGLMYGYTDGSFRPNKGVLYEEAVTAILRVLGYSDTDYIGSYPMGQLSFANDLELTEGVECSRGKVISRYAMSRLLYNALSVPNKNSSGKIYAEALGYSQATEMLRLDDFVKDTVSGPVTYLNTSLSALTGLADPKVYIDGTNSSASEIKRYDIVYYSKKSNTVWVYTAKVTGLLEAITPNREAPTSVTIAGKTYPLNYSNARKAFGLDGLETGTLVTALLDKSGNIYDAYTADSLYSTQLGVVTSAGAKQVTLTGGKTEMRYYANLLLLDGSTIEFERESSAASLIGKAVEINYSTGALKAYTSSSLNSVSGTVNSDSLLWGKSQTLSKDIRILEIDDYGNYTTLSLDRLNGVYLEGKKVVLFSKAANGAIDGMVLNNVCGDTAQYGQVTGSSIVNTGGVPSGTRYSYTIGNSSGTCVLPHVVSDITTGPAAFYLNGGQAMEIRNLKQVSSVRSLTYSYLETTSGEKYRISPSVLVYRAVGSVRTATTMDEAMQKSWKYTAFYDEEPAKGGMIRMLYISEK